MSFSVKDKEFFKKYNKIWDKVSNITKIKFSIELLFDKKYLKAEERVWSKNNTKEYIYISVILIDSVYVRNKNFCAQVVLEKYKYVVKKKRSYFITDYIKIYSDDSNYSDDSDKKTQM